MLGIEMLDFDSCTFIGYVLAPFLAVGIYVSSLYSAALRRSTDWKDEG